MQLLQDWHANEQARIRIMLVLFRAAQAARARLGRKHPIALAVASLHHIFATIVVGCELPVSVVVGPRLRIWHGFGLVINSGSVLGADVALRHGVTIGDDGRSPGSPVIEDGVEVGTGATIIGPIRVGTGARIGAHALVLRDVEAGGRARAPQAEIDAPRSAE